MRTIIILCAATLFGCGTTDITRPPSEEDLRALLLTAIRIEIPEILVAQADPVFGGEIWFEFVVNGNLRLRWPETGTAKVENGMWYQIDAWYNLYLAPEDILTVFIHGVEEDRPPGPPMNPDDDMGFIWLEFSHEDNFGIRQTAYLERSTCPDACFEAKILIHRKEDEQGGQS